jgi:hypothetical protein
LCEINGYSPQEKIKMKIILIFGLLLAETVFAKELPWQTFNSCLKELEAKASENSPYYLSETDKNSRYIFKRSPQIDGNPANRGFFHLTESGIQFCELNYPNQGGFKFKMGEGEGAREITYNNSEKPGLISKNPPKCVPSDDSGRVYFTNQIHAMAERMSEAQKKDTTSTAWEYKNAEAVMKNIPSCKSVPRLREVISRSIKSRATKSDVSGEVGK